MNAREMKWLAWWLCLNAIQGLRDSGWPYEMTDNGQAVYYDGEQEIVLEDKEGQLTEDGKRLEAALDSVQATMCKRGHK